MRELRRLIKLYVGYVFEGLEGDMLRGQIHRQILHYFAKIPGWSEEYETRLNLILWSYNAINTDKMEEKKYQQFLKENILAFLHELQENTQKFEREREICQTIGLNSDTSK